MTPEKSPRRVHLLEHIIGYAGFFRLIRYGLQFERHDGTMSRPIAREVFARGDAVMVIPYDPVRQEVLLVEQFRAGAYANAARTAHPWLLEFPAGMIEPGQSPEEAARREVSEETGLVVGDGAGALQQLYSYFTSPGGCSERITLFVAHVSLADFDTLPHRGNHHEDEDIKVHRVPVAELNRLIEAGQIADASTLLGVAALQLSCTF
jgi:ADP-ribose pyrophosphatase